MDPAVLIHLLNRRQTQGLSSWAGSLDSFFFFFFVLLYSQSFVLMHKLFSLFLYRQQVCLVVLKWSHGMALRQRDRSKLSPPEQHLNSCPQGIFNALYLTLQDWSFFMYLKLNKTFHNLNFHKLKLTWKCETLIPCFKVKYQVHSSFPSQHLSFPLVHLCLPLTFIIL